MTTQTQTMSETEAWVRNEWPRLAVVPQGPYGPEGPVPPYRLRIKLIGDEPIYQGADGEENVCKSLGQYWSSESSRAEMWADAKRYTEEDDGLIGNIRRRLQYWSTFIDDGGFAIDPSVHRSMALLRARLAELLRGRREGA